MKTKEELDVLKDEFETMNKKLAELSEEELAQISGGLQGTVRQMYLIIDLINYVESNKGLWGGKTKGLSQLFKKNDLSFSDIELYLNSNRGLGDNFIDDLFEKYIRQGYYA